MHLLTAQPLACQNHVVKISCIIAKGRDVAIRGDESKLTSNPIIQLSRAENLVVSPGITATWISGPHLFLPPDLVGEVQGFQESAPGPVSLGDSSGCLLSMVILLMLITTVRRYNSSCLTLFGYPVDL